MPRAADACESDASYGSVLVKSVYFLVFACGVALTAPLVAGDGASRAVADRRLPPWPTHFQGRMLTQLPLTAREEAFVRGFPGSVARFTDDERDIVFRWVTRPTRQLHAAEDCYRGLGFAVAAAHVVEDADSTSWRCFVAERSGEKHEVCEQFADPDGRRWSDVSAWYWTATLGGSAGPWLATTVAARTN
jgi:hypothetical protein